MKRFRILGLCLIAAFALSVAVVASAQAGTSASGPIKVESTGEGEAELGNSVSNIKCKSHTAHSEIISAVEAVKVVARYKGCEVAGKGIPCENVGPAEIETTSLVSKLAWVSKTKGEVGVDFKPESGVLLADFTCKGVAEVKVYGAIIGLTTPKNVMTETGKVTFQEKGFKNQPENFEGGPNEHLEAEFIPPGGKKVESGQIQKDNTKNHGNPCKTKKGKETCKPDLAEVNTIASGSPQYGRCKKKGAGAKFSDTNCTQASAKGKFGFVPIPG
jgi:hypothetical protein